MNNRNQSPSNKELAIAAAALTAAASLVGASALHAANYDPSSSKSDISPEVEISPFEQFESEEVVRAVNEPAPAVTPTALPTLRPLKQITLQAAPQVIRTPQPVLPTEKPKVTPTEEPKDTGLGIPIVPISPPEQEKSDTPTTDMVPEKETTYTPLDAENMDVPKDISEILAKDTVYMDGIGCSGSLIRDAYGEQIGVITAEHCSLEGKNNTHRVSGSDGNLYSVFSTGIEAMTGDQKSSLVSAGVIEKFYLPAADDYQHDLALGSFKGKSLEEVIHAYDQMRLNKDEIASLNVGDTAFLSGWPVYQPGHSFDMKRQVFPMKVIGAGESDTSGGQQLEVIWTAIAKDSLNDQRTDRTSCSFGNSGGEGRIQLGGSIRSLGDLAVYIDLTGDIYPAGKEYIDEHIAEFSERYNLDPEELGKMSAICGFSYVPPAPELGAEQVTIVESVNDIPGYNELYSADAQVKLIREKYFDPEENKFVVDGVVEFTSSNPDETANIFVDRPSVHYIERMNAAVVGWHDPSAEDGLRLEYVENIGFLNIYDRDQTEGVPVLQTSGAITVSKTKDEKDIFLDESGIGYGQRIASDTSYIDYENSYGLYYSVPDMKGGPSERQLMTYHHNRKGGGK